MVAPSKEKEAKVESKLLKDATPQEMLTELRDRKVMFIFGMAEDEGSDYAVATCANGSQLIAMGLLEMVRQRLTELD